MVLILPSRFEVYRAGRTFRIAPQFNGVPFHGSGVEQEKAPGECLTDVQQRFHHFGSLDSADNASH
jgi:hypothetical protein